MSRAKIDGVTYEVVPHVCNHGGGLIEWCVCDIDTDHKSDDARIEPHSDPDRLKYKAGTKYPKGHWQNPVNQTMRSES